MLGIKQARRTYVCIFADICVKHLGKDIQKTYVIEGGPGSRITRVGGLVL